MTTLTKHPGDVYVLTMHFKSFSVDAVYEMHERMDQLEKIKGKLALITVSDHRKLYSGGLDFKVFTLPMARLKQFVYLFTDLLSRML